MKFAGLADSPPTMLCRLVVVLALSGADALNLGAAASRRSFITKAAAAAGSLAVAAPVFAEAPALNLAGRGGMTGTREKYQQDVRGGDSAAASGKSGIVTKNSFDGTFSDPAHSDLPRKISWVGNRDYLIDGADEEEAVEGDCQEDERPHARRRLLVQGRTLGRDRQGAGQRRHLLPGRQRLEEALEAGPDSRDLYAQTHNAEGLT